MDAQLQAALIRLLTGTADAMTAGASFLQAELPEVVRQLLLWKLISALTVGSLLAAVAIVWFVIATRKVVRWEAKAEEPSKGLGWALFLAFSLPALTAGAGAIALYLRAVQIWLAPKVYLLEYVARLVKGD